MSTLVERLRKVGEDYDFHGNALIYEAAYAIEALQAENERLRTDGACWKHLHDEMAVERDTLQAKLQRQEPVIDFTVLHRFASDQAISYNKLCTAVRMCLAAPKALEPLTEAAERCCQHDSDCAIHNMPAYPAGPCDCSLQTVAWVSVEKGDVSKAILYFDENEEIKPLGVIGAATTRKAHGITKGTP